MWEPGKCMDGRLNAAYHEFQAWAKIRKIPQLGNSVCSFCFANYMLLMVGMILGIVSLLSVMGNSCVELILSKWPPRATMCYTHHCLNFVDFTYTWVSIFTLRLGSSSLGLVIFVLHITVDTQKKLNFACLRSWCILALFGYMYFAFLKPEFFALMFWRKVALGRIPQPDGKS